MTSLWDNLSRRFQRQYGQAAHALYHAPGRVNLMGASTSAQNGFVLPCAIGFGTTLIMAPTRGNKVNAGQSDDPSQQVSWDPDHFPPTSDRDPMWINHIQGVLMALRARGYRLTGLNIMVHASLPPGVALEDSASLGVALTYGLNDLFHLGLSPQGIAQVSQQAKREVNARQDSLVDPLISAIASENHATLIDCKTLSWQGIPMPDSAHLVVFNIQGGMSPHWHLEQERQRQCSQAACYFNQPSLREVSLDQLNAGRQQMPPQLFRRARHVISENQRVLALADALVQQDYRAIGQLMASSHQSLSGDFELASPAIDALVGITRSALGDQGGVRMNGIGCYGDVVALMPETIKSAVIKQVMQEYPKQSELYATFISTRASSGACRVR
ncbi:galactokinase [Ferrimonas sediminum]|uniref:Galactokinase n=1 Tax=Ferrimonas sediminum TaxID=718193 RepID=A0A1G8VJ17_9GAMM|nr:galactokinase family protein [Ferrimonas sediminum]SDJ66048.1 galactokinase [Ferrimonas sediminum]